MDAPYRQRMERLGRLLLRARKGRYTLEELASRAGVSSGLISQIERGVGNPSFRTLQSLAGALGLPVAALFQDDDESDPDAAAGHATVRKGEPHRFVVRRDGRRKLLFPNEGMTWELLTPDLQRRLGLLRAVVPPDYDTSSFPFVHAGEEATHIVRGKMEIHLGSDVYCLGPGDTITYDSGITHWWRNVGGEEAEVIAASTPPSF